MQNSNLPSFYRNRLDGTAAETNIIELAAFKTGMTAAKTIAISPATPTEFLKLRAS